MVVLPLWNCRGQVWSPPGVGGAWARAGGGTIASTSNGTRSVATTRLIDAIRQVIRFLLLVDCSERQSPMRLPRAIELGGVSSTRDSLGKEELELKTQLPIRPEPRSLCVEERLQLGIHRQPNLAHSPYLPPTAAHRDGPVITAAGREVGRHDRRAGEIPAVRQVVVEKRLDQQLVEILIAPTRKGPLLVDERADYPGTIHEQTHGRGSHAPFATAEEIIARSWQRHGRPHAPDQLARLGRRQKERGVDVS